MTIWEWVIDGCGERFEAVERAIEHVFEEHTRTEYVREYDADRRRGDPRTRRGVGAPRRSRERSEREPEER